jgi:hypothetical protein
MFFIHKPLSKLVLIVSKFIEDLLQICRHRLQCFQDGNFACREHALALTKIEEALHWLKHRTADRQRRGVEGKSEK